MAGSRNRHSSEPGAEPESTNVNGYLLLTYLIAGVVWTWPCPPELAHFRRGCSTTWTSWRSSCPTSPGSGTPPEALQLELTESAAMASPASAMSAITRLRHKGVRLSLDDFGTVYSSLAYLRILPVHELKIDRSFVNELSDANKNASIVRSVIELEHNLDLRVVEDRESRGVPLVGGSRLRRRPGSLPRCPGRCRRSPSHPRRSGRPGPMTWPRFGPVRTRSRHGQRAHRSA